MKGFYKFEDRISLGHDSWISIYRFELIDEKRANIEFVYIGKDKRRHESRIARKVPEMGNNFWRFKYDGNIFVFEMS